MRAFAILARACIVAAALSALAAGGCGNKSEQDRAAAKDKAKANDRDEAEGTDSDDEGADGSAGFGDLDFLSSMLSKQLGAPGPYDEPRASPGFAADSEHFAIMELGGPIVELASFSLLSGTMGTELGAIRKKLDELAADEHVKGLLLRVDDLPIAMATAEELRHALEAFKGDSQRALHCHTEGVSTITYHVLGACDSIGLAPTGQIVISGVAAVPIHIKGLLDKLGLRPDFLHVGAYKGAAEPLTRDRPSNEMRETIDAILDQSYATLVAGIARGRGMEPAAARALIDQAMFTDEDARAARLVDTVEIYETYRDGVVDKAEWTVVKPGKSAKPGLMDLMRFVGVVPRARPWRDHVALVYAVGSVIDGKGQGVVGARQEIASRTLSAALRALGRDDKVKAVVVRIDSGGGSALASELIWNAVAEVRAQKPVIVSMGSMAASGGYYIACGADMIFALDNTLTGSIGVVGGKLAMRGTLGKLGIKAYPMGRGKRALMGSMVDAWSTDERKAVQGVMEAIYQRFVMRVATGRKQSQDQVDSLARGRVWTGARAREHGLVDAIGGLDAALARARELGEVDADVDVEIYPPEPTLVDLLGAFGQVQAGMVPGVDMGMGMDDMPAAVTRLVANMARDVGVAEARAVAMMLEQVLLLRSAPVLAVTFWPVAMH